MSYNVRYFGHSLRGAGSTRGCLSSIATSIAQLAPPPEIICLQEVETRSIRSHFSLARDNPELTQLDVLARELDLALREAGHDIRYHAHYFPAHEYRVRGARPLYTTGLAILSAKHLEIDKHNSADPHDITHRGPKFAWLKQSRICAHLRFRDLDGRAFDIFNTHLSLPSWRKTPGFFSRGRPNMGYGPNQKEEVDRLVEFIEAERAGPRFMLMGDFNALPESPAYNHVLEKLGVRDPFPEYTGDSLLELRRKWPTAGFMHLRMRLDHMLLGSGFQHVDFDDTHPFGDAEGRWHGLSDHVPLVGRFEG